MEHSHFHKINVYADLLNDKQWCALDIIIDSIEENGKQHIENPVVEGLDESFPVDVFRVVTYNNKQKEITKTDYSHQILDLFTQANIIKKIEEITGINNLDILRMQINLFKEGHYLIPHKDSQFDSDFLITVIFKTQNLHCDGGELIYQTKNSHETHKQPNHTSFILNSNCEHEVTKIKKGRRNTLIAVLGKMQSKSS